MTSDPHYDDVLRETAAILQRFAERTDDEACLARRDALLQRGPALHELGRVEEAYECYGEFLRLFDDQAVVARDDVLSCLLQRGRLGVRLGRPAAALEDLECVLEREGHLRSWSPFLRESAYWHKADALYDLGQTDPALDTVGLLCQAVMGDTSRPDARRWASGALAKKAAMLGWLGREDEALSVYEALWRDFRSDEDPDTPARVTEAGLQIGRIYREGGRAEEALEILTAVVADAALFADRDRPVNLALYEQARALLDLDHEEDALGALKMLEARLIDKTGDDDQGLLASTLHVRASVLARVDSDGLSLSALAADVRHRAELTQSIAVREQYLSALVAALPGLQLTRRWEDVISACDALAGSAAVPNGFRLAAAALYDKAAALSELGRNAAAASVLVDLISKYGSDPAAEEVVGLARASHQQLSDINELEA